MSDKPDPQITHQIYTISPLLYLNHFDFDYHKYSQILKIVFYSSHLGFPISASNFYRTTQVNTSRALPGLLK